MECGIECTTWILWDSFKLAELNTIYSCQCVCVSVWLIISILSIFLSIHQLIYQVSQLNASYSTVFTTKAQLKPMKLCNHNLEHFLPYRCLPLSFYISKIDLFVVCVRCARCADQIRQIHLAVSFAFNMRSYHVCVCFCIGRMSMSVCGKWRWFDCLHLS